MLNLNSAQLREETPHSINGNRTTLADALKRRAHAIINDKSIDAHTRALIRYGLEINDPDLPELIRSADNGESILDSLSAISIEEKLSTLTDLICRAGEDPAAALLGGRYRADRYVVRCGSHTTTLILASLARKPPNYFFVQGCDSLDRVSMMSLKSRAPNVDRVSSRAAGAEKAKFSDIFPVNL